MKIKRMNKNVNNLYTPPVLKDYTFVFEEEERKRRERKERRRQKQIYTHFGQIL
jgi:hypothetical protein